MQASAVPLWRRLRVPSPFRRSGLRGRMTVSYVVVTLGSVISFLLLVTLTTGVLAALFSNASDDNNFLTVLQGQAQSYALVASLQSQGTALEPQINFIPGQAHTIALPGQQYQVYNVYAPYIATTSPGPASVTIALLITPEGHVLASSYPSRYPAGTDIAALFPEQRQAIGRALSGQASTGTEHASSAPLGYAAEPVLGRNGQPIGAIFLQVPEPQQDGIFSRLLNALLTNSFLLVIVIPIGVFFGRVTTRGLLQRVQQLVLATTRFAGGDYTQRVEPHHQDEIGQLEQQFNQMAEQLVENIALQKHLAEQNARLEERSRISRELHDAISQDLFSLRMLADGLQEATRAGSSPSNLRPHIALLEQTTSNMTREMRALLLELRPTQLEELGLAGALEKLAHMYSVRLGITVSADVAPLSLAVKTEHALLRIAQEALANAARHSNASLISLCLAAHTDEATLIVQDNGSGFDAQAIEERHGLGLQLMRERVQELHGTLALETAPGKGTCLTVTLPLEEVHD